jgi:hypothetical protein
VKIIQSAAELRIGFLTTDRNPDRDNIIYYNYSSKIYCIFFLKEKVSQEMIKCQCPIIFTTFSIYFKVNPLLTESKFDYIAKQMQNYLRKDNHLIYKTIVFSVTSLIALHLADFPPRFRQYCIPIQMVSLDF